MTPSLIHLEDNKLWPLHFCLLSSSLVYELLWSTYRKITLSNKTTLPQRCNLPDSTQTFINVIQIYRLITGKCIKTTSLWPKPDLWSKPHVLHQRGGGDHPATSYKTTLKPQRRHLMSQSQLPFCGSWTIIIVSAFGVLTSRILWNILRAFFHCNHITGAHASHSSSSNDSDAMMTTPAAAALLKNFKYDVKLRMLVT